MQNLKRCNINALNENQCIIDTLQIAKKKFLGQSVSLDSLCRKYNIDLSERKTHGALKDAKLLASVYLELIGGRQSKLDFGAKDSTKIMKKKTLHLILMNIILIYKKREKNT